VHTTCDLNVTVKSEELFSVTGSYVHNILETMRNRDVVTTGHYQEMIYNLSSSNNCSELECTGRSFLKCKTFRMGCFVYLCTSSKDFDWHGHQSFPICFNHLLRSMASSLFNLRAW